jgi:hypothetical protein
VLGFEIAYRRPEERFVYLERDSAQVMLCQRNGRYETGAMEPPLGRGAMFQLYAPTIEPIRAALAAVDWPIYEPPRDAWYRVGAQEFGQRQFFVQDPDGYLLMIAHHLGQRPAPRSGQAALTPTPGPSGPRAGRAARRPSRCAGRRPPHPRSRGS